jgi:hypothetical protein
MTIKMIVMMVIMMININKPERILSLLQWEFLYLMDMPAYRVIPINVGTKRTESPNKVPVYDDSDIKLWL